MQPKPDDLGIYDCQLPLELHHLAEEPTVPILLYGL